MIPQKLIGTIYTVAVKIKLQPTWGAGVGYFSTYDALTDSYSWYEFEECTYLLIPCGRKGNYIDTTLYIRVDTEKTDADLKCCAQHILEQKFLSNVYDGSIVRIGKPKIFLKPHVFEHDDSEYRSEKIIDLITQ
jgi:hypothetical protein